MRIKTQGRLRFRLGLAVLVAPLAAAAPRLVLPVSASGRDSQHEKRRLPPGNWGGMHVAMEVSEGGARLEHDCAHGSIDEAFVLDEKGRFDLQGTHVPEHAGPVRQGEASGQPARYTGTIDGDQMTLTIRLVDSDKEWATFTLTRGRTGRIRKCS